MKTKVTLTTLNNWRGLHQWTTAMALLFFLAMTGAARAVSVTNVIYYDTFHRTGQLVGTAPDTVNAPGAVWCGGVGTNGLVTGGMAASITNALPFVPPYAAAFLPLNLETGHVYVVTCTVIGNSNTPSGQLAFGYAIEPGLDTGPENNANWGIDWVEVNPSNNGCSYWPYGGIRDFSASYPWTQSMTYSTVLNLITNYAGGLTNMSGSFYTNGVLAYSAPFVPSGRMTEHGMYPGFVFLGMSSANTAGSFTNFSVTDIVPNATTPTILEQPNSLTAQSGQTATFWIRAYGLPDPNYQWQVNTGSGFVNISGATNASYTTPALSPANSGAQYEVVCSTAAGSTTSSAATLTVNPGTPTVYSATKSSANLTNIIVNFSGPVDPTTSQNPANYALQVNGVSAGISIVGVSAGSVPSSVVLQTSTLNTNTGYYLTVSGVKDAVGDAMSGTSTNPVFPAGLVFYFRAGSGVELDGNGNVAQWADMTTNGNNASQFFGMYPNINGTYLSGVTTRPATNSFGANNLPGISFNSSADDYLTIPAEESMDLSGNLTMYCYASPASSSAQEVISEDNGNIPCGFELQLAATSLSPDLLFGDGNNYGTWNASGSTLAVAPHVWSLVSQIVGQTYTASTVAVTNDIYWYVDGSPFGGGGTGQAVSSGATVRAEFDDRPVFLGGRMDHGAFFNGSMGEYMLFNGPLSGADRTNVDNYLGQKYFQFSWTSPLPSAATTTNGFPYTYTIGANEGSLHFSYQWQENGTNIPGANGGSYTISPAGPANSNDVYDVILTLPDGISYTSTVSTLTVLPEPPYVTSSGMPLWETPNPTNIVLIFDVAVDPATATTASNYSLNSGSVLSAAIGDEPNKVVLTTSALSWNANPGNYSLTVKNVQDMYSDTMVTTSLPIGLYPITALWLEATNGIGIDSGNSSYAGVSTWNDQSGNGNQMSDFGYPPPYEPVFTTNAFGHPVVHFIGTNYTFLAANPATSLAITNDMAVFAVMTFANLLGGTGTNGEIISKTGEGTSGNKAAPYDYYVATNDATFFRGNGSSYGNVISTNIPLVGYPQLVGVNETGNDVIHYFNEETVGSNVLSGGWQESSDVDQGQPLYIGARSDGGNRLNGDIAEMILIGQSLDSNDLVSIQNYLVSKYDLPTGTNTYAVITQQPIAGTNLSQGATLVVSAAGSGTPQVTYQWYDTNNVLQVGQTNATLTINDIQASDGYYMVAANTFNAATSSVVTVTVISGLNVSLGPPSVTLYAGQSFTYTAQVTGTIPFYYQWYQGGSPIANATNSSYTATASPGSTTYSCTVTNPYEGYSSTNAGPLVLTGIAAPTNAFSQLVLSDGPVAYWRLNEPAGSTIAYDYVGGYNGTYGINTTNGLPGVPFIGDSSELGAAMDNTASTVTNGSITTPGINLNGNNVTLLCWVLPFTNQFNPSGLIFSRTGTNVFGSVVGASEQFDYNWNNNASTYNYGSGLVVATNIWSLTALTITPSNAVLYCFSSVTNGSATSSIANPPQSFAGGLNIGADSQATNRIFNGEMNEVAIFNHALSASQLSQLYTAAIGAPNVNPNPTNIVFSVTNNQLYLSWPADHIGWQLQAQTNPMSVGISNNWANYNPSTGTNQIVIPVNLTNGTVFYRLIYTP